jgi:hypothetical protein
VIVVDHHLVPEKRCPRSRSEPAPRRMAFPAGLCSRPRPEPRRGGAFGA